VQVVAGVGPAVDPLGELDAGHAVGAGLAGHLLGPLAVALNGDVPTGQQA
jgi:hypothetical protein